MKARNKRLMFVVVGVCGLGIAAALVLSAFQSNLVFFYSPTQVKNNEAPANRAFRLGGMVKEGSVQRQSDGLTVNFLVTDNAETIQVQYKGILPDLFKEGQGMVAQGKLGDGGMFVATEVLAKHDETYMPPEVADALEKGKAAKEGMTSSSLVTQ
jgi:cytochrome c-type biogenesis protein CcmE